MAKKQHKTAEQIRQEEIELAAKERAKNIEIAFQNCRRLNRAVRFSFIREIIKAVKCEDQEAESVFAGWVKSGKVVQDGESGGVKIYLCKGVAYM